MRKAHTLLYLRNTKSSKQKKTSLNTGLNGKLHLCLKINKEGVSFCEQQNRCQLLIGKVEKS